jgi:hypothetical protein
MYKGFVSCPIDSHRAQVSATREEHRTYDGSISFRPSTRCFQIQSFSSSMSKRDRTINENPAFVICWQNFFSQWVFGSKSGSKVRDQNSFHATRRRGDAASFCQCTYLIVLTLPSCLGCCVVCFNADLHTNWFTGN